jgi:DNA (cytosine-5)-methyltransferase 1
MDEHKDAQSAITYIDLFAGIGGFRTAINQASSDLNFKAECVFSSDIDPDARKAYQANYGEMPHGDITKIHEDEIPNHDLLFPVKHSALLVR